MFKYFSKYIIILLFSTSVVSASDDLNFYGYISFLHNKQFKIPELDTLGNTIRNNSESKWDIAKFNLILQQSFTNNFQLYLNLSNKFEVNNAFGEYSFNQFYNFRLGKIYRRFGLYNEIRDAAPFYYGSELPEIVQLEHKIFDINTNFMFFGTKDFGRKTLKYSLNFSLIDNINEGNSFPFGVDIRYGKESNFIIGSSFYYSGTKAISDVKVGNGYSNNGVMPWMEYDQFTVTGLFLEYNLNEFIIQSEFTYSPHNAVRSPEKVLEMFDGVSKLGNPLSNSQIQLFKIDNDKPMELSNIKKNINYNIISWYFKTSYILSSDYGIFIPFFNLEYYSNPEMIENVQFGGDNESGISKEGIIKKFDFGSTYYPIQQVSIKLAFGLNQFEFNDENVLTTEYSLEVFYIFGN